MEPSIVMNRCFKVGDKIETYFPAKTMVIRITGTVAFINGDMLTVKVNRLNKRKQSSTWFASVHVSQALEATT